MKGVDARFDGDFSETFDCEKSVEMRAAKGGMSKACVLEQVKVLTGMIAQMMDILSPWCYGMEL